LRDKDDVVDPPRHLLLANATPPFQGGEPLKNMLVQKQIAFGLEQNNNM
jgi:hypothetical protein